MMMYKRHFLTALFIFVFSFSSYAQFDSPDTLYYDGPELTGEMKEIYEYYNFLKNPPSIEQLIDLAMANAPMLKAQDALIGKIAFDVKRTKNSWLDALLVGSEFRYGSYGNEALDDLTLGYSLGAGVRFSVYDITSIRAQIGIFQQERKIAEYKMEELQQLITKQLIVYYNNVLLKQRLLEVKAQGERSALIHLKMAEKEFIEGDVPVSELARVSEIHAKAKAELTICYTEFKDAYMLLEQFLGVDLKEIAIELKD